MDLTKLIHTPDQLVTEHTENPYLHVVHNHEPRRNEALPPGDDPDARYYMMMLSAPSFVYCGLHCLLILLLIPQDSKTRHSWYEALVVALGGGYCVSRFMNAVFAWLGDRAAGTSSNGNLVHFMLTGAGHRLFPDDVRFTNLNPIVSLVSAFFVWLFTGGQYNETLRLMALGWMALQSWSWLVHYLHHAHPEFIAQHLLGWMRHAPHAHPTYVRRCLFNQQAPQGKKQE